MWFKRYGASEYKVGAKAPGRTEKENNGTPRYGHDGAGRAP
jgi:hypothetical protein